MQLLFAHGLESGPSGRKTAWLRDAGHDVVAPDCRGMDLSQRIAVIERHLVELGRTLVVGSSFGGIAALVATVAAHRRGITAQGLLLCAPALQLPPPPPWPTELAPPCPCIVVHGTRDEIIPIELSREFVRRRHAAPPASGGSAIELVECDDDHSLAGARELLLDSLGRLAALG
jgi:pimeloyl-ACP methyl ester carboxylesterase